MKPFSALLDDFRLTVVPLERPRDIGLASYVGSGDCKAVNNPGS